jgi:hypothetical protein
MYGVALGHEGGAQPDQLRFLASSRRSQQAPRSDVPKCGQREDDRPATIRPIILGEHRGRDRGLCATAGVGHRGDRRYLVDRAPIADRGQ